MIRNLLLTLLLIVPVALFGQSQLIEGFDSTPADSAHWGTEITYCSDAANTFTHNSLTASPVFDGDSALYVDYQVTDCAGWGGYTKFEHWHPDSQSVYDFSLYDSIAFYVNVITPQTVPGDITMRFQLFDVSNGADGNATYGAGNVEFYYSFQPGVLDAAGGWQRIVLPLLDDDNWWSGEGFNRTGWVGITGNDVLDKDKIKGYAFEFSINGGGDGSESHGAIVLDRLELVGLAKVPLVIFNGRDFPTNMSEFTWGQSQLYVEEGTGSSAGKNSMRWIQGNEWGNGWSGAGFNISPAANLTASWPSDSLKFWLKTVPNCPLTRFQFEDGAAKVGKAFTPEADGEWHHYAWKLNELDPIDGTSGFNPANITVFHLMGEGNAEAGREFWFDDVWTGNPVIDVVAPGAVQNVNAIGVPGGYYNIIAWSDFADESGEVYSVYASQDPISDVNAAGVELVGVVVKGEQNISHYLVYPLTDEQQTWYYAVACKDQAGNVGPATNSSPVVNTARGVATYAIEAPANFVVDGDFAEWDAAGIMPVELKKSNGFSYVSYGTITDDADMTANIYMAMDDDYLYIGISVLEDNFTWAGGDFWMSDAVEYFIGLYDFRDAAHKSMKRGSEPDYKMVFTQDYVRRDPNWFLLGDPAVADGDYAFEDWGGGEYAYEARIALDSLQTADDTRFHRKNGMRITHEITMHDNDNGVAEGKMVTSPKNKDSAWYDPQVWSYTWIGDTTDVASAIGDNNGNVITQFSLKQNYPNPFNPSTTIYYDLAKASTVKLEVYNVLGQKVSTLVNSRQLKGAYQVVFDGANLTSGVYFYKIEAGEFSSVKKMLLVK